MHSRLLLQPLERRSARPTATRPAVAKGEPIECVEAHAQRKAAERASARLLRLLQDHHDLDHDVLDKTRGRQ